MHVLITGASGLVGRALSQTLTERGATVVAVSRTPEHQEPTPGLTWISWDDLDTHVDQADAVVHLAGEGVVDQRWSSARKQALIDSRTDTTTRLVHAIQAARRKPAVFISTSAVGYYGAQGHDPDDSALDESSGPGTGFLAELCQAWEAAADGAGVRTVTLRFGIVLSTEGGALKKMLRPFKLGLGGPIGRGRQAMSWIHIDDAVRFILHAIDDESLEGPVNATAPHPVTNKEFSRALGRALGRPALFPVPPLILKLQLGEGASVLTTGQRVVPRRAEAADFRFQHPEIDGALLDLVA